MSPLRTFLHSALLVVAATFVAACYSGIDPAREPEPEGPPTVTSVSPSSGSSVGAAYVEIRGTNFTRPTIVTFGNVPAMDAYAVTPNELQVTTPTHLAGTVDVHITTRNGTLTLPGAYTFTAAPPTLTRIEPDSGLTSGGEEVMVVGTNFVMGTSVTIGGAPCTQVILESEFAIVARTPAGAVGAADVVVTTPDGTATLAGAFTYNGNAPTLQGIAPATGSETGGTLVTLTGGDFVAPVSVTFGGTAATSVTVVDAGTLTAITPVGVPGNADVVVTTAYGSATLSQAFSFAAASLFVTNSQTSSVSVHGLNANGDTAPTRVLSGGNTSLYHPIGVCVAGGKVYVSNIDDDRITVHAESASGNAAPLQVFAGGATGIDGPTGLCVDLTRGELFVANVFADTITVHEASSTGNVAPLRVLAGANTGLSDPEGAWTVDNELFVANATGGGSGQGSITVYGIADSGNATPRRTIGGPSTGLDSPQGLFVGHGYLFVANRDSNTVTVYPIGANGDVAPTRQIDGVTTGIQQPQAVFATATELFVANSGSSTITVYPLAATGNAAPLRTIGGAATTLHTIEGLFVR